MSAQKQMLLPAVPTDLVIVDADTKLPKHIRQSQNSNSMGLRGRTHKIKSGDKVYEYYYPGVLDLLLHIEINGNFFMPKPHAALFEKWLSNKRVRVIRFRGEPVGLDTSTLMRLKEQALFNYLKPADHSEINHLRWFENNDSSAMELLESEDQTITDYTVTKIWLIDWTPQRRVTDELQIRYNLNMDPLNFKDIVKTPAATNIFD
ncbi:MAG: hypothetical protein Q7J10_09215 [Methanosarcinaceae archaeon]|nr:hypothetical protein [Methanosarcinaceae archaeon]